MPANPDIGVILNRAPPWRLSRDALSLHPRRVHSEYAGRLRTALYSQIGRLRDDFSSKRRWGITACLALTAPVLGGR